MLFHMYIFMVYNKVVAKIKELCVLNYDNVHRYFDKI